MTHKYPAVLPPQAIEAIELADAAHHHALVEAYVLVEKYKVQRDEMSERLRKVEKQYDTAVQSRLMLRDGFRKWREKAMKLEAWIQEYGWPIMDELEQWQNGHPPLAALQEKLSVAERQLGETHLALTEAELRSGDTRERLAAYAHEAWSEYMAYHLSKCESSADGALTIPAGYVVALRDLIARPFADLPEIQKDYDRAEADKMLAVLNTEAERRLTESGARDG